MTHSWQNEEGEPIMDGAAWRFEQQLDADLAAERLRDEWENERWADYEPDITPDNCPQGGNFTYLDGGIVRCDDCYQEGGSWVIGEDGWHTITVDPHDAPTD
jgi:hypothetical protein